ncbi:MAG: Uma2 family endonuclease [Chloroflexota bacterium]|nr:Uma2 family endonuclease [Chloroflexota bacterium]
MIAPAVERIDALPLEEFVQRYEVEGPFELIDGEIVAKMPNVSGHAKPIKRLFIAFLAFEAQGIGEVFQETTFVLTDDPRWVKGSRIPDVMFVLKAKLEAFQSIPDHELKPYILVPDIAVEVVSPTDQYSDVMKKVRRYLADGVTLVWVVDPQIREVMVFRHGVDQPTILMGDDILTADPVLTGYAMKLSDLFG